MRDTSRAKSSLCVGSSDSSEPFVHRAKAVKLQRTPVLYPRFPSRARLYGKSSA